ncbi:MAG: RNA polymerase sigma factor [Ruminococcus sp.]|nr:RNA polymerase sigma factor [Ruminococcus sp.]
MRRKKQEKFERIYSQYKDNVLKISYMYLKDYQLAEDATQETFCRVLSKIGTLKDETKDKAWVSKIAVNVCRDILKHKSRREIPAVDITLKENSNPDIDSKLSVTEAIRTLPQELRECVILFYYQGFTHREIAEILNVPDTTVAYRLRKGKEQLRNLLEEDFDD